MKRSTIIILGVVIIAAAVAALFGWQTLTASAAATTTNRLQTATVQRGTIVATVNAAGNVSAPEEAAMAFQTTGRVAQVNVQVGDTVKKSQVLMSLDTTDLSLALRSAQANLASAQANYDSAKAKQATNPDQLTAAKAAVDKAASTLQQAQAAYDRIGGATNPNIGMTSQSVTLQQAYADYQAAVSNYKVTAGSINNTALQAAQAQVDSAQVAVEQAQANLEKTKIIAPYDGVVAAVNYTTGDTVGSATAVTVVDMSNLQVSVMVAEVDLPKIKVGETAQMTLDALPGSTYTAKVMRIDPVGTVTQGVVNYPVTVAITDADGTIKPGMTANLAVAVDQRTNALLVPVRAVRSTGNQKTVTVEYKGQTIQVPVTTGLANDQSVEILSGLKEGDIVVMNQTQTSTSGNNFRGFGGGPLGIPIGGGQHGSGN